MRVLAWCGVIAPMLRLGLILVLGFLHPSYSQPRDFISELGAPDSLFAPVMNYAGISLVGVLLALFSIALYRAHKPSSLALAGAVLLALSGLAFVVVGLFPCDQPACTLTDPSPTMRVHLLAGMAALTTQTLSPLALGLRVVGGTVDRKYSALSLVLGSIALVALVLLLGQGARLTYPGLVQKIVQVATDLWVLASAIYVVRRWQPTA